MVKQSSQSCSRVASLACCLLLAWCKAAYSQDIEVASVSGTPIVSTDLPLATARLPTPEGGWTFANTYRVASPPVVDVKTGVLELKIQHRTIPGVTADAAYWLYRNLHRTVWYRPPNATKPSPVALFQLLHPVDHLSFRCTTCTSQRNQVTIGSSLDFIELQMSKCRNLTRNQWNCSDAITGKDKRVGFVRSDSSTLWFKKFVPTKVTSTVTQLSTSGYKAVGEAQGYKISYVAHNFANAKDAQGAHLGLNVTTTIRIGLLKNSPTASGEFVYDTRSFAFGYVNAAVSDALQNGTDVTPLRRIGNGMVLHSIQEWQNLANWLMPVYAANSGSMPADV